MARNKSIFEKWGFVELKDEYKEKLEEMDENEMIDDSFLEQIAAMSEDNNGIEEKLDKFIESYEKNKLLSIEDIYRNSNLVKDTRDSIFIADVFLKTLPENLPVDLKKESVLNILKVSNIVVEDLMTDAYERVDALNTVMEDTVQRTDEIIEKNSVAIRDLERRIEELKNVIEERKKFQNTQNTSIEYEIQKVISIVDFIKPKK